MSKKLFVGNLPFKTREEDLIEAFSQFGEVESATIIRDKFSKRSRGFGFVEMKTEEQAKDALEGLNGKDLGGRSLVVDFAREK